MRVAYKNIQKYLTGNRVDGGCLVINVVQVVHSVARNFLTSFVWVLQVLHSAGAELTHEVRQGRASLKSLRSLVFLYFYLFTFIFLLLSFIFYLLS